jgi:transposase
LSVRTVADVLERAGRFRLLEDTAAAVRDHLAVLDLRQPPATEAALGERTLTILDRLETVCRAEEHLEQRLNTAFDLHPHATVYRSFPCLGSTLGARIFAEIGDDPARFPTARHLRAYAGAAPITWESSTSRTVTYRRAANRLLRTAVHHWAFGALTRSPGCRVRYDERRAQGDRYAAALRIVGGRLLAGLHRCLETGQPYAEAVMWSTRRDDGTGQEASTLL